MVRFQEVVRNCLDSEETTGQNSWELIGSGWEVFFFLHGSVFEEDEDGDQQRETASSDGSTKESGSHMLGGCRPGGGHLLVLLQSGYGEDGVHSREAADKKKKTKKKNRRFENVNEKRQERVEGRH